MAQANDSITVTPGAGATVATELISSKEYQAIVVADAKGHIVGGREVFVASDDTGLAAAAANSTPLALFNASATHSLEIVHVYLTAFSAAVTGLIRSFRLHRITTNVSAGATAVTPVPLDSAHSLTASVTVNRQTAAATPMTGHVISGVSMARAMRYEEETGGGPARIDMFRERDVGEPIVCRQNQGIIIVQDATAGLGTLFATVVFRQRAN